MNNQFQGQMANPGFNQNYGQQVRKISTNELQPNTYFMVEGQIEFSRLYSKIEGEELANRNRNDRSRGLQVTDTPYTTATINHAKVLQLGPTKSLAEQYGEQKLYKSKNDPGNMKFQGRNKGNSLPTIYQQAEPSNLNLKQIVLDGDLAVGSDVILIMKVFKGNTNNGVSLEGVIVKGDIKLYAGNDASQFLKAQGFNVETVSTNNYNNAEEINMADYRNAMDTQTSYGPIPEQIQAPPEMVQQPIQQGPTFSPNQGMNPQEFGQSGWMPNNNPYDEQPPQPGVRFQG